MVSAYEYIAADHRTAAARTVDKIWKSTELLAKHPMAGREGRIGGTRELVVRGTPFIVAYRVGRSGVEREEWIRDEMLPAHEEHSS